MKETRPPVLEIRRTDFSRLKNGMEQCFRVGNEPAQ